MLGFANQFILWFAKTPRESSILWTANYRVLKAVSYIWNPAYLNRLIWFERLALAQQSFQTKQKVVLMNSLSLKSVGRVKFFLECLAPSRSSESSGNSPRVWLFEFVVQRLQFLLLFLHRQFCRVAGLEKPGRQFYQPLNSTINLKIKTSLQNYTFIDKIG